MLEETGQSVNLENYSVAERKMFKRGCHSQHKERRETQTSLRLHPCFSFPVRTSASHVALSSLQTFFPSMRFRDVSQMHLPREHTVLWVLSLLSTCEKTVQSDTMSHTYFTKDKKRQKMSFKEKGTQTCSTVHEGR